MAYENFNTMIYIVFYLGILLLICIRKDLTFRKKIIIVGFITFIVLSILTLYFFIYFDSGLEQKTFDRKG